MKNLIFAIILLFAINNINAQDRFESTTIDLIIIDDKETFTDLFEEQNVGNLHCYSRLTNQNSSTYFFEGKIIAPKFEQHLDWTIKEKMNQMKESAFAVGAVRGKNLDNELYILRIPQTNKTDLLILTKNDNNKLTMKKELAYFRKKGKKLYQMDSWMQDINGDTRLDLIQKKRTITANGKVMNKKTVVYLQKQNGKFKRTKNSIIEIGDYKMQSWK